MLLLRFDSPCTGFPKDRMLLVRWEEVLLDRDCGPSVGSSTAETLLRGFPCDDVEDLKVSSESLRACPRCSLCVPDLEGLDLGAEGVRRLGAARKPSYSKKSSRAPSVCLFLSFSFPFPFSFSFFCFLSEAVSPFFLENMIRDRRPCLLWGCC